MKSVVIVDDEFALVDTLKDFLEYAGYRVETASNGQQGLAVVKQRRPDLVLTDMMMPVMTGKETLVVIRADPDLVAIPVIVMSAARRQVAIPAGEDFPTFSGFLRKPFQLKPLMDMITALIGPRDAEG